MKIEDYFKIFQIAYDKMNEVSYIDIYEKGEWILANDISINEYRTEYIILKRGLSFPVKDNSTKVRIKC